MSVGSPASAFAVQAPAVSGGTASAKIIGNLRGDAEGERRSAEMDKLAGLLTDHLPEAFSVDRIGEGILVVGPGHEGGTAPWNDALQYLRLTLKANPRFHAFIVGHSREQDSDSEDMSLSYRQAELIKKFLIEARPGEIEGSRIMTAGRGRMEPIVANDTASGRQRNSRIEIAYYIPFEEPSADGAGE